MSDLISRSALIEDIEAAIDNNGMGYVIGQTLKRYAKRLPAVDAVEVVRCRECKHCSKNTPDGWHWCDEHERGCLDDDDFCSYGERRTDG